METLEMTIFINKIADREKVIKTLQDDGIKVSDAGFTMIEAICTEEYADSFGKKLIDKGIDYHAIAY